MRAPRAAAKDRRRTPSPFVSHCVALLMPLGPVMPKAMFGGWGLYLDGRMFALIARDMLHFKTDDQTKGRFAAAGSEPFVYHNRSAPVETSYWRVPEGAMNDPDVLLPWAEFAVAAARRAAAANSRARSRNCRE